jgi:D-alanyl-D-alanine carboxypeptidase
MKEKINFFTHKLTAGADFAIIGTVLGLTAIGFGVYGYIHTTHELSVIKSDLITTKESYDAKIALLDSTLFEVKNENSALSNTLSEEQKKTGSIVSSLTGSVQNLEKLSKSDPELLKKYSKTYFLNEHYVPLSLTHIDANYVVDANKNLEIHSSVYPFLKKLLDDAAAKSLTLRLASAYRSFGTQAQLKASYRVTYGAGTANQFSAEQGYSEHQLGTTVDFTTVVIGGGLSGFDSTSEYKWLLDNGYKYGFVISYPQSNTYYEYEPWHWRFVGVVLATKLHADKVDFYMLDQRIIDTYLANMFD